MKRCRSRKLASCCTYQEGDTEEELILFRFVLFTVWTVRQSAADMKYFNLKWRGNLVNLFRLFRSLTQQNHCALCATPYRCLWKPEEWEDANR
jgi:hypothetical protein